MAAIVVHFTYPPAGVSSVTIADGDAFPVQIISGGFGGAVTIADGADVAEGAVADAIVAAGAVGSLSAKLRRTTQGLEDLKSLIVLAAGSAIIGKIGIDQTTPGTTNLVAETPVSGGVGSAVPNTQAIAVTTTGAGYVASDVVGGIISLTTVNYSTGRRVTLKSVTIKEKGGVTPALHLYFFKATPNGGTYTDNANLVWGSGDAANQVGLLNVLAADYVTDVSQSSVNYSGLTMKMPVSATTLFLLIVSQGAYTITNGDLTIDLEFDQE